MRIWLDPYKLEKYKLIPKDVENAINAQNSQASAGRLGAMPEGFSKVVLHDDAFQIDLENKLCRVWEPTLFDKTDSRTVDHPDWKYTLA